MNPTETTETVPVEAAAQTELRTKGERRGFKSAAEVEKEGLAKGENPAAPVDNEPVGDVELPEEFVFQDPNAEPEVGEPEVDAPAVAAQEADGNYRIGGRTFKTQKEAFDFAEELDRQQLANDAFRQGLEAAQNQAISNTPNMPKMPSEPEQIPEEFYTNPAAYHAKLKRQIVEEATQMASQQLDMRSRHETTMNKFWSDYPDLARNASTKKLTERVLSEQFNVLKNVDTEKALRIVAEKSRAELRDLGVTILPTKTLNSNSKPAASSGSSQGVTRQKLDEKPLNFVQQMRSIKAKRQGSNSRA